MTKYEVQTYTLCDGWINCWTVTDEHGSRPETFATRAEAQAEIDDLFEEIERQIQAGERSEEDGYSRDDYRIVELGTCCIPGGTSHE